MKAQVLVNKPFGAYTVGQVVDIEVDEAGTPLRLEWRRRLADAVTDGCCELVKRQKKESTK